MTDAAGRSRDRRGYPRARDSRHDGNGAILTFSERAMRGQHPHLLVHGEAILSEDIEGGL